LDSRKLNGVWFSVALDSEGKILASSFNLKSKDKAVAAVRSSIRRDARVRIRSDQNTLRALKALKEIFFGRGLTEVEVNLNTFPRFTRRVYELIMSIPRGYVSTYGGVASLLGKRRASRAVGNAMANNPLPLFVPCHRVVLSTLRVGNYGLSSMGKTLGSGVKFELLKREGVKFEGDKVSLRNLWKPKG
jgi:methylated-DNA-[protein]-cysteine S-methyltransferase